MKTGDRIEKPWGWERILDLNDRYCVKHLFVKSGHRLSEQYHERKRETLFLISGAAELTLQTNGKPSAVAPMTLGEPCPIEPGVVHRIRSTTPEGALILEVSSTELDDVVRLDDDYGRA